MFAEETTVMNQETEEKSFDNIAKDIIMDVFKKKVKRNIWENSEWKEIAELENDDVGKAGEAIVESFCKAAGVSASIDGLKTKGGEGDGIINSKSVEIKTARQGSSGGSFQHELGEKPWKADYMLFLDISPDCMYLTLFKNFDEEFYKKSGSDSGVKCLPVFPSRSVCWRKQQGAFKLDTTIDINEKNLMKQPNPTFKITKDALDKEQFGMFINSIIPLPESIEIVP